MFVLEQPSQYEQGRDGKYRDGFASCAMTLMHRGAFTGEPVSSEDAQDEERHPVCEWVGDPVQRSHVRQGLEKADGPDEAVGCAELESSKRPGPVRPSRTTRNSEAIRAYATTPWIVKARGIVPVSTNTLGEAQPALRQGSSVVRRSSRAW